MNFLKRVWTWLMSDDDYLRREREKPTQRSRDYEKIYGSERGRL